MSHQIDQDIAFERRYWRVQRIAWLVMLAIVGLALAGLFGGGPISYYIVQDRGPLAVDAVLPRFSRFTDSETALMKISADTPPGTTQMTISISRSLVNLIGPLRFEPAPNQTLQSSDAIIYIFALSGSGGQAQAAVTYQPHVGGLAWGTVRVEAGGLVSEIGPFWTFVFP